MRKILSTLFGLAALLVLLGSAGCGGDGNADPTEVVSEDEVTIKIRVVDTAGDPVAGLAMGVANVLPELPSLKTPDKATANIKFYLPYRAHVYLVIMNCDSETVRVLVDNDRDSSQYTAVWDGKDDDEEYAPSGRYTVRLVGRLIGSEELVYDESHDLYFTQPEAIHGPTDGNGLIVLRDRSLFPQFYDGGAMLCLDSAGGEVVPVGSDSPYFNLTVAMRFTFLDPATDAHQIYTADINAEEQSVKFVWDPEAKALIPGDLADGQFEFEAPAAIPEGWTLYPPYPNPF